MRFFIKLGVVDRQRRVTPKHRGQLEVLQIEASRIFRIQDHQRTQHLHPFDQRDAHHRLDIETFDHLVIHVRSVHGIIDQDRFSFAATRAPSKCGS